MQRTRSNWFLALLLAHVFAQAVPAADPLAPIPSPAQVRPISLHEAIQLALTENFAIAIDTYTPQVFRYNLRSAYGVYDPTFNIAAFRSFNSSRGGVDPEGIELPSTEIESDSLSPSLSGYLPSGMTYEISSAVGERSFTPPGASQFTASAGVTVTQPLLRDLWIDSNRAQIMLSKRDLKISEWAFRWQVMQTLTAVESAYYNLIFAMENVKVQEKALELLERLLVENRRRVEVGTMAPLEEQQAKSQVAASRAQLLEAQRVLANRQNALKNLITQDYSEWHSLFLQPEERLVPVPYDFNLTESWRKGLALRPDLHQARLDVERREIDLRLRKNQLFPAVDVVASYGYNGLDRLGRSYNTAIDDLASGDNPRWSVGVLLSVPLGNITARNRHKAAIALEKQAELAAEQVEQLILVEIDDAVQLAQAAYERVEATREARQFAEAALDAEQKKLESGKSTSFFVLQFQRDLTAARFEEIRALAEYNIALAQLALAEGTTLERHKVSLQSE